LFEKIRDISVTMLPLKEEIHDLELEQKRLLRQIAECRTDLRISDFIEYQVGKRTHRGKIIRMKPNYKKVLKWISCWLIWVTICIFAVWMSNWRGWIMAVSCVSVIFTEVVLMIYVWGEIDAAPWWYTLFCEKNRKR